MFPCQDRASPTGQRRTEIGSLPMTKYKREHTLPLGPLAISTIGAIPRSDDYMFPGREQEGPFNGWSKSKARFDINCGVIGWTLHDLRRTFATVHASIGTPPHVIERLLNHVTGTISRVAAISNRWHYMDEMREAVSTYERHLQRLCAR